MALEIHEGAMVNRKVKKWAQQHGWTNISFVYLTTSFATCHKVSDDMMNDYAD
jgi:hypothetical protein